MQMSCPPLQELFFGLQKFTKLEFINRQASHPNKDLKS